MKTYIGIDPGWKKLGFAILIWDESQDKPIAKYLETLDMSFNTQGKIISRINLGNNPEVIGLERYVSYGNVRSTHTEDITRVIGMIEMYVFIQNLNSVKQTSLNTIRAIDWKTELVQNLSRHFGFDNKFTALDKDFSMQAAKFIVSNPESIKTDHEADAICIAALPIIKDKIKQLDKNNKKGDSHQYSIDL